MPKIFIVTGLLLIGWCIFILFGNHIWELIT